MKSFPIIFRFVSGSETPFSPSRKSPEASTYSSAILNRSRNVLTTASDSSFRMSPLLMCMQVSRSPIAR